MPIEPRKVMMAVDDAGAMRQIEVETLRHINDTLVALSADMRDARERLIRIESNQLDRTVQTHEGLLQAQAARIDALEREKDKRDGASNIIAVILKSPTFGWMVGAAVTAWAILTGRVHP